jgi:hypothetical protein
MAEQKATNITWHDHKVLKAERSKLNGHKGAVLWFTGLSACGKSTVAIISCIRAASTPWCWMATTSGTG